MAMGDVNMTASEIEGVATDDDDMADDGCCPTCGAPMTDGAEGAPAPGGATDPMQIGMAPSGLASVDRLSEARALLAGL